MATEVYFTNKYLGIFYAMCTFFVAICLLFNNQLRMLLKKAHISHICLASGDFPWALELQPLSSRPISKYNLTF